ncbi:MAG: flippase-like domain-containing protein [Candidatus Eisenbacteria bacterium]|nr:flippase-like domain-containing protein [Candidatus Eisenbacteria bacterium]
MRRSIRIILALGAGAALLALALHGIDVSEITENIGRADWRYLALGGLLYVVAYLVRSVRWRLILMPVTRVSVRDSFFMLMAGYFLNYVIPIRAGEIAKSFFLKRLKGIPIATSLPTVYVDKVFELVSIIFVVVAVPVLSIRVEGPLAVLIYSVLAIFLAAVGILILAFRRGEAATKLLCGLFSWLPSGPRARLTQWISLFVDGMGIARENVRTVVPLIGLTVAAVLIDASYFLMMFRAFAIDVPYVSVLFGYTLLTLSYILPTPPAQIGYNEFVIRLIFAGGIGVASIPKAEVMAVIIVAHALTGLIITGVGVGSFAAMGIKVSESFRATGPASDACETVGE